MADGLVRGEPSVIAVSREKIEVLRSALGDQTGVVFVDMDDIGRNPACLIPAYHDFVRRDAANGPCRGVGEPVGPHRQGAELVECEIHEALCNLAFTTTKWWVICPYDTTTLDRVVIDEAFRNHPVLLEKGRRRPSPTYRAPPPSEPPGGPLPEPPEGTQQLALMPGSLRDVRRFVSDHANAIGLSADQVSDLVVAVDEVVANTLRHATGEGVLRIWAEGRRVLAEVEDQGRIGDPLIGRHPTIEVGRSRGLRIVNQLCDLVQVRSGPRGTTVRLHMAVTE